MSRCNHLRAKVKNEKHRRKRWTQIGVGCTVVFMNKNTWTGKGVGNKDYAVAMVELRRSGAAGKHADKRTKRMKTRAARKSAALREW